MQEVVHTALADLSADLSSKPTAAPTAHLSVDDLMARANKLCSEVAANAAAPAATFDCEASKMAPSCHDLPLVDEDILSAGGTHTESAVPPLLPATLSSSVTAIKLNVFRVVPQIASLVSTHGRTESAWPATTWTTSTSTLTCDLDTSML